MLKDLKLDGTAYLNFNKTLYDASLWEIVEDERYTKLYNNSLLIKDKTTGVVFEWYGNKLLLSTIDMEVNEVVMANFRDRFYALDRDKVIEQFNKKYTY